MILERLNFWQDASTAEMLKQLNQYGFITFMNKFAIFDTFRKQDNLKDYDLMYDRIANNEQAKDFEFPDFKDTTVETRYFICKLNGEPAKGVTFDKSYFKDVTGCINHVAPKTEKKMYPPQFYKYITEREDWDIQPEEIYLDAAQMEELFQEYMQEINLLVTKLKRLKDDGKENTPEFSSFILKLNDLAPDLAKEFKAS